MTKRAKGKFKRSKNDYYRTPKEPVAPLLPHIKHMTSFEEPCAGAGDLIDHLEDAGFHCTYSADIEPRRRDIAKFDAMRQKGTTADAYITNPPWTRELLHPLIIHLSDIAPTWLLFDADWAHTVQATPYLKRCPKIVSVGRVSWMGNGVSGFDNCAWYLFDKAYSGEPIFYGSEN